MITSAIPHPVDFSPFYERNLNIRLLISLNVLYIADNTAGSQIWISVTE
jgi:hypothetical protein